MRAAPIAILVLVAALLVGCGSSGGEPAVPRPTAGGSSAQAIRAAWEHRPDCKRPPGASRWSCSLGSYRCQAVVTDRGWSVDCAKPGLSVAFMVRRG